jgi:hypothetical protein
MCSDSLQAEISGLISGKIEGDYWDFKSEWYGNQSDLLHDIICMANNTADHDGYIIIGVGDDGAVLGGASTDSNRRTQQNIVDFLKDKKFAGNIRPSINVRTFRLGGKDIDVIIVKCTDKTPYYLTEDFQGIHKGNIYTRIGDTNTPKNATANVDKAEHLWKKRFGIDKTSLEKVTLLLKNPKDWLPSGTDGEHSSDDFDYTWYNKRSPEFKISYEIDESRFNEGKIDLVEQEMYWMNKLPKPLHNAYIYELSIQYHSTVVYTTLAIFADTLRFQRVLWKKKYLYQIPLLNS